jgi:hypothetical protein
MGSLTPHLLEPGDHGRLPFHPSCPVCRRERLLGTLSQEPVVSRRTQAVVASGVLAFSAGAPGLAVAAVPDRQAEGIAAPEDLPGAEVDDPAFDPGGETSLPFETAPAPSVTDDDDGEGAPIDAEPIDDPDGRLAPLVAEDGDSAEGDGSPTSDEVPPAIGDGTSGVTGTPSPPATAPPVAVDVGVPDSPSTSPTHETQRDRRSEKRPAREGPELEEQTPVAQAPAPAVPPPAEENLTVPATQPASTTPSSAAAARERGSSLRDARAYVVQSGDSLWSIAKRLLGADASPAQIAREVNRLWSLNEERIATGDPDLLMVGTKLTLR